MKPFTFETIVDSVRVGAVWFRRSEGLEVADEDARRIVRDLAVIFEGTGDDSPSRRMLTDAIVREFRKLLDEKHMAALGAVPMLGDKLQPIEDEL